MIAVDDDIYCVRDGSGSRAYLLNLRGNIVLIDGTSEVRGTALLSALAELGASPESVKMILLTHGHADNLAAVHLFHSAEICAHVLEIPEIQRPQGLGGDGVISHLRAMFGKPIPPIKVNRPLRDADVVSFGVHNFLALHTPGHTRGSISYILRDVLFPGDALTALGDEILPPKEVYDRGIAFETLKRLLDYVFFVVCPTHGDIVYGAREKLERSLPEK
ncbi:MAG: MBL fold metallo-hydrolase [bacterium]